MILLQSLLNEVTNWQAISKSTGKIVYFISKQNRDAAIKKGTHIDPKTSKKPDYFDKIQKYLKTADLFKGDYSKKRNTKVKPPIQSSKVNIISKTIGNIDNLYKQMVSRWADKKEKHVVKKEKAVIKQQGEWIKKLIKDGVINSDEYDSAMFDWQYNVNKSALNAIDKFLKKYQPPPIETNEPVYRGIIVSKKEYLKLLEDFNNKKNIKLPIGSFTTFFDTATKFANPIEHPVIDESHKPYSVVFRVKSECDRLNAFSMNSNIVSKQLKAVVKKYSDEHEILMPSNQKYKVDKINYVKFSDKISFAKSMAFIDLVQKCSKNEGVDDDMDLTNDKFYVDLFQTNMRLEKKGD
jgi:hypothetical protein